MFCRIISENLTVLLKKYPAVVMRQHNELTEFLANTHNIVHREDFFCVLVSVFLIRPHVIIIKRKYLA